MQVLAATVIATILAALTGPSSGVGLAVLIAIYSVAVYADRRESRAALALTLIAVAVVVTLVLASTDPALPLTMVPLGVVIVWTIVGAVWLLGDLVRSRSEAVEELRQRNAELVIEREENARLAVADERARIARELHDAVAHSLSVMVVQAGAARRALETAEPGGEVAAERARGALAAIEATGRDTLSEMRRVVGALRPTGDEPYEPQPSLDGLERLLTTVREAGLPVELVVEGEARPIPRGVDLSAYRDRPGGADQHPEARRRRVRPGLAALRRRRARVGVTRRGRGAAARLLEAPHRGLRPGRHARAGRHVGGELEARPAAERRLRRAAHGCPLGRSLRRDASGRHRRRPGRCCATGFRMILDAERDMRWSARPANGRRRSTLTRAARARRGPDGHPDAGDGRHRGDAPHPSAPARRPVRAAGPDPDHLRPRRVHRRRRCGPARAASCSRTSRRRSWRRRSAWSPPATRCWRPSITRRLLDRFASHAPGRPAQRPAPGRVRRAHRARARGVHAGRARACRTRRSPTSWCSARRPSRPTSSRVFSKLGLRDRVQAVVLAYETGIVRPGEGRIVPGDEDAARR